MGYTRYHSHQLYHVCHKEYLLVPGNGSCSAHPCLGEYLLYKYAYDAGEYRIDVVRVLFHQYHNLHRVVLVL